MSVRAKASCLGSQPEGCSPAEPWPRTRLAPVGWFVLQGCGNGQALVAPWVTRGHSLSRKEQLQPRARGSAGCLQQQCKQSKERKGHAPRHRVMGTWRGGRAVFKVHSGDESPLRARRGVTAPSSGVPHPTLQSRSLLST